MFVRSAASLIAASAIGLVVAPLHAQQAQPATTAQSQSRSASPPNPSIPGMARASQAIGKPVLDAQGKPVAVIRDFVVDSSGGLTALVERTGTTGLTGVPFGSLTPQLVQTPASASPTPATNSRTATPSPTVTVDRFVFPGNVAQLQQAPPLQDVALVDDAWLAQVRQTYGVAATTLPASTTGQVARKPIGLQALLQRRVSDARGEQLGTVKDLAISLGNRRASFVVFDGTAADGKNPMFHGVELDSFSFQDPHSLVLPTDRATLSQSSGLELERLPAQASFTLPGGGPKTLRTTDQPAGAPSKPAPEQPSSPSTPR